MATCGGDPTWQPNKPKMKGNEGPKGQNERKWKPKRPKWKEMKAQKAKMKGNESPKGQNERKWRPKRPKWKEMKPKRPKWKEMKAQKAKMKEMKAQKAKMKGNEGPRGQKCAKMQPPRRWAKFFGWICISERYHFGQGLWWQIWARAAFWKAKNERKWRPKRPKWNEMKTQKAKMKGNEGPKRPKWNLDGRCQSLIKAHG